MIKMTILQDGRRRCICCFIWTLFAVALLGGCSRPREISKSESVAVQPTSVDPALVLAALPDQRVVEITSFSSKVSVPDVIPWPKGSEAGLVYEQWYRVGYAFAFVTGEQWLRDQVSRRDKLETERAKFRGWFDGNSAGGLAKRLSDAESAMGQIMSNRARVRP